MDQNPPHSKLIGTKERDAKKTDNSVLNQTYDHPMLRGHTGITCEVFITKSSHVETKPLVFL